MVWNDCAEYDLLNLSSFYVPSSLYGGPEAVRSCVKQIQKTFDNIGTADTAQPNTQTSCKYSQQKQKFLQGTVKSGEHDHARHIYCWTLCIF